MPKNKNKIDDILVEFKEKFCPNDIWDTKLITFELEYWLKQKLQKVEEHETENGYCCACEYDIACMNEKIEIAVQKKVDEIKKSKTKIVGILFNAQNSPIEYSLQEIADKIIKIIKN